MNELITILAGMAPVSEVRGAIPLGLLFGFSPLKAYLLGVLGNILPVIPVLLLLRYLSEWLMRRIYWINRLLSRLFQYTRDRHAQKFAEAEQRHHHTHFWFSWRREIVLLIFVAVPLPLTGIWSGILAAFVFGLPFWRSVLALVLGAAAAGAIVTLISLPLAI